MQVARWIAASILTTTICVGAEDPAAVVNAAFFDSKIRPILTTHCYKCHGEERSESELRVDSYDAILEGGVSGDFVLPDDPNSSLLLIAVGYRNEDLQMPPDGKLDDEQIADLRKWVAAGLPHPDAKKRLPKVPEKKPSVAAELWSFIAPTESHLPEVRDPSWTRTSIDYYLLHELEIRELRPHTDADKRSLLRRVTYDLIGLPPTRSEIVDFLADDSPSAFEKVVDRLLSSPHYGERWARHWLDVARYADSNGLDENVAHGNAWRYRDYVIGSLNADKPFDRFVREQVAGDLLPAADEATRHEQLIATGFLSLGAKVLAEVDERKMEMDIVDEQIDTLGRSLLALTLGCARCHDHKFDPIQTEDYYALAGVFRSTKTMESFTKVARWNENVIATPEERAAQETHAQKVASSKALITDAVDKANKSLLESLGPDAKLPSDAETRYSEETKQSLKKLRDELAQLEKNAPVVSSAMGVVEGTTADTAVCVRGSHLTEGKVVPRGVPGQLAAAAPAFPSGQSGRKELADWLVDRRNPLTARVIVNRVWRWHFGRGLVESTDNFGQLGDRPTNQALLDSLSVWFVDQGWSLKKLHRLILVSSAYRQASGQSDVASAESSQAGDVRRAATLDPDNRWLWEFPIRRLEAEVIRDAALAVSGRLDWTRGGSLLHVANRAYFFDHTSKDETKYDSTRRSIYLPVVRNNLYDVFQLFDATDATVPSGDRASSTVATQALFMLNSELIRESGREMAESILAEPGDDRARVEGIYERCYGRLPSEVELSRSLEFIRTFCSSSPNSQLTADEIRLEGWTGFCHAMLASNEFIYVK